MKKSELLTRLRAKNNKRPFGAFIMLLFFALLFNAQNMYSQDKTITGTVIDETGQPLPGASVLVKGTNNGSQTDFDGNYSVSVTSDATTLIISYVGFIAQEIAIADKSSINIQLVADASQLDEVVVVGYGTQKKVNLTGAVGIVGGEVLEDRPIVNMGEGLKGVIPNLNVDIRNGDPSGPITFNIRGYGSINGGSPLILVDGVPMDLNLLNPNDIESISVLKDASAAAVYGARAAFGVVLVTTKKGKSGKINATFSGELALAAPIMFIDPITDPYAYVTARNMASQRTNNADSFDQDYIDGTKRYSENPTAQNEWGVFNNQLRFYGNNDYQNKILTDLSPQQRYNMAVSGANENASFYVSLGYLDKSGYLKNESQNEKFERYNILLKSDYQINKWLKMDSRALITTEKYDQPHFYNWDVNVNTTARVNPLNPLTFPDLDSYLVPGDRADFEDYIGMHFSSVNFLPYLEQGGRDTRRKDDVVFTQGMNLTPIKGLNIRGEFSMNYRFQNAQEVRSKVDVLENSDLTALRIGNGFSATDYINNRSDNNQYYVLNTYADYTIDKYENHYIKAMVGFNQEWGNQQYIRAQAYNLITPAIVDLNATTGNQETYGGKSHVSLRGVFYRLNYIYKDKYLLELNGRYDGTSRFPTDDRFGFFPSFSAGWKVSEESFMEGTSNWLNNLKVRASYGTLGNQLLGNDYYPAIPTMGSATSPYMFQAGARSPYVSAAGLVSPTLTWESVTTQNIGVDFTTFKGRLDASFDLFHRDTEDMLMGVEYPSILGTSAPKSNAADLRTSGWEFSGKWRDRINEDWDYGVSLALANSTTEITDYENPTGAINEYYIGQQIGEIWGYETVGIFQTPEEVAAAPTQGDIGANWRPGDIQYADLDNSGNIDQGSGTLEDPGDRRILGNSQAQYTFGINTNVGYKNFSLSLFFQGVGKQDYLPPNGNWVAFYPFNAGHVENYYLTDTWSETNRDAYFAAPHISTNTKQNIQPQSRYVQDASYIRLRNLTFGYEIPSNVMEKIGLSSASVYFSGQNLWEATKMRKPLDPEVRPTLTQEYYKERIYSFGLKVTL
jgi:TonB-linked SusC/RagA family outer membrane protein